MTDRKYYIKRISMAFFLGLMLLGCNQSGEQSGNQNVTKNKGEDYPEIGKPCPNFELRDMVYYKTQKATLKDFKGKPLILDFWTRFCKSCIKSFPKVNELQEKFGDKIQFILVGKDSSGVYKGTRELYEKVRQKYNLKLPVAYDNGALFQKFGVASVPHIIWIDAGGTVRAITKSSEVNCENIQAFLEGKNLTMTEKDNADEEKAKRRAYDSGKPLLIDSNGGEAADFRYRSVLTRGNSETYSTYTDYFRPRSLSGNKEGYQAVNISLSNLYKVAYGDTILPYPIKISVPTSYGKYWVKPVLEVTDSSAFEVDWGTKKGLYCYSLIVPAEKHTTTLNKQKMMRRDLENYFDYKVKVENRLMPYWKLTVATENIRNRLLTKGGKTKRQGDGLSKVKFTNYPVAILIRELWSFNQSGPPFIDETGITGNIDITLEGVLTDFHEFRKALRENGLELQKEEKEMKVIIIRDPESDEIL